MSVSRVASVLLGAAVAATYAVSAGSAAVPPLVTVPSYRETVPVTHSGDTADDPAIWVNPQDASRSLVIGNDKRGALESYDLQGELVQRISDATTFWGNVDVRGNLVAVFHAGGIRLWRVNASTRRMNVASVPAGIRTAGEGVCMYRSGDGTFVFAVARNNGSRVRQFELVDPDGDRLFAGELRRTFLVGSEAEGCAADDDTGALYISEEDRGLWRYSADPDGGTARTLVDSVVPLGGRIQPDAEGITIAGDRVIVSAQSSSYPRQSYFVAYTRATNAYVGAFRVGDGPTSDDCDGTDGIAAHAGRLGPDFPYGLLVCQDGQNHSPTANQDFKLVRWELLP